MFASNYRKSLVVFTILYAAPIGVFAQTSESQKSRRVREHVAELGRSYSRMIQHNDAGAIAKILAEDYLLADEEGKVFTKAQDLATYPGKKLRVKITSIEYLEQNVRLISKDVAIDHSTIRFIGTSGGKPFDITERCTTTWAKRKGTWLIVADHFSIRPPNK